MRKARPCATRVGREATRRGFARAPRRAVLGDGAPWIWNLATEHVPDAIHIVDRFHAKQHLSDAGDIDAVLCALRAHSPKDEEARTCLGDVDRHRARMRDAEFREQGLCTSTGVVEAGGTVAIGTRCKRAGMPGTVAGADAIIALRCGKLSGRFEDFWERRSAAATLAA